MKILRALILLTAIGVLGCGDPKSRIFFASSGITVGAPVTTSTGNYRIPIEFETEIVHSGQWIDTVEAEVDGTEILITTVFTHTNRKSRYPGYVEISDEVLDPTRSSIGTQMVLATWSKRSPFPETMKPNPQVSFGCEAHQS